MKYQFNDKFKSVWCRNTLSVKKTLKPLNSLLCTSISVIKFMKRYSFKYAEPSVNNISTFCQVADQLLQQNIERYFFFISVQLRGLYRFLWKIALLTISYFLNTRFCIAVLCVYVHDVIKRMFLFSLEVSWQLLNLYLVKFR